MVPPPTSLAWMPPAASCWPPKSTLGFCPLLSKGPRQKELLSPTHPFACEDKPRGPELWGAAPGSCCSHTPSTLGLGTLASHLECCSLQAGMVASLGRAGVRQLAPSGAQLGSLPPVVL